MTDKQHPIDEIAQPASSRRIRFADDALQVLEDLLNSDAKQDLSPRQRALAYDTVGLLRRVTEGLIEGHSRIRENLLEMMTLASEGKLPLRLEVAAELALKSGAHTGFTETVSEGQIGSSWNKRHQRER